MATHNYYLTLLLLIAFHRDIAARQQINTLTNCDGLSNSSITCIFQDHKGIMWFGTWGGLNKFDGRNTFSFIHESDDANSISNNTVRNIMESDQRYLWIATDYGINKLDCRTGVFHKYYPRYERENQISENSYKITVGKDGTVFCAVLNWGLFFYAPEMDKFLDLNIHERNSDISEIVADDNNCLWILMKNGDLLQNKYVNESGVIRIISSKVCPYAKIQKIFKDFDKTLWLHSRSRQRILHFNPNTGKLLDTIPITADFRKDEVVFVCKRGEEIWINFSDHGLYSYADESFTRIEDFNAYSISSIFQGTQDITWLGTDGKGILYLHEQYDTFQKISNISLGQKKISPIRCFMEDRNGNIWIGSKGEGIFIWNDGKTIRNINSDNGLSNNSVYTIVKAFGNLLLVGSDGNGIDVFNTKFEKVQQILPDSVSCSSIYDILPDEEQGIIWAGTSGHGLIRLDVEITGNHIFLKSERQYVHNEADECSLSNNIIYSIKKISKDGLLIGTRGGGLNIFNVTEDKFETVKTDSNGNNLSSFDILSLHKHDDQSFWIGTSYGLNHLRLSGQKRIITSYTGREISNLTIHGIIESSANVLWLSTNRGLTRFDARSGDFTNYFDQSDLQNNEFSDGAYYLSPTGICFFGGISGFNFFKAENIQKRDFTPCLSITGIRIKNDNTAPFFPGQALELGYNDNFFTIYFNALDYINNNNCEYAYRMDGYNKEWIHTLNDNRAIFTNIKPGKYTLDIKSTNSDKVWCENTISIPINIKHPWWLSWWMYILETLIAFGIISMIIHQIKNRMTLKKELLIEKIQKLEQEKSLNEKLDFFTNIAHEFCTPLTLILGPCERMAEESILNKKDMKYIQIIRSNARRMKLLINELMDFRKSDSEHKKLIYEQIDIKELISCIIDNFSELNEETDISLIFNIESTTDDYNFKSDRYSIETIVYNLVSNAYKYTPICGHINIAVHLSEEELNLSISNSGHGIKQEDLETVFDKFKILDNIEKQAKKGEQIRNGIGLALTRSLCTNLNGDITVKSIIDESTTFKVTLPQYEGELTGVQENFQNHMFSEEKIVTCGNNDKFKVLVVDDEPEIRFLVKDILGKYFRVEEAENGIDALNKMKYGRPNLIICDIIMPEMDGIQFVRELKDNHYTNHIPIIFLTSKSNIEDQIEGLETGVEAYVPKPFYPRHLLAVVKQIVSNRESLRQYYKSSLSAGDFFNDRYISMEDRGLLVNITKFIEENIPNEDLNSNLICSSLSITRVHLYRKLKELTDKTPSEYIRNIRINFAENLLISTSHTVKEIMYSSGFNNKSYFYREFMKKNNCSPKEYREQHKST